MANIQVATAFATPSTFLADGTATGYSASDVGDYMHPYRVWRGSGVITSGTSYIGIDLGAAQTIVAAYVDNINTTSVKVESATSAAWAGLTTEATATVSQDPTDGRYKLFQLINSGTGRSRQFWRVLANSSSTTDSSPAMRVGGLTLVTALTTLTSNPGMPLDAVSVTAVQPTQMAGGGDEVSGLGNPYAVLTFSQSILSRTSANETEFFSWARPGQHVPVLIYINASDTSRAYMCRRVGDVALSTPGPGHYSYSGLTFKEVC